MASRIPKINSSNAWLHKIDWLPSLSFQYPWLVLFLSCTTKLDLSSFKAKIHDIFFPSTNWLLLGSIGFSVLLCMLHVNLGGGTIQSCLLGLLEYWKRATIAWQKFNHKGFGKGICQCFASHWHNCVLHPRQMRPRLREMEQHLRHQGWLPHQEVEWIFERMTK